MRRLLSLLLALAATGAFAQEPVPPAVPPDPEDPNAGTPLDPRPRFKYSLEDCVRLALDHNIDLQYSRLEPGLYEADLTAVRGAYDPVAYVNSNLRRSHTPTASALSGASVLVDEDWVVAAGFKGTLLLGTVWDLSFNTNRGETNSTFTTLNPRWTSSLGFSLRQPILKAAWLDYNLVTAQITHNSLRSATRQVEEDTVLTLYNVEFAYLTLVNTIQQRGVKVRALLLAQRLLEVARNKVKAGALAPIEELRAEAEVASQREGIILAENAIEDAQDELKKLIRPFEKPGDWDFVIVPSEEPAFVPRAVDANDAILKALENRPELEQLRIGLETNDLTISKYERDLWPTFDLTGGWRWSGLGSNFGNSLEGVESSDFDTWELGFVFEYPLGTRSAKGALRRAEIEKRRAGLVLKSLEQTVVLEVRDAVREITSTIQRIEATKTASRLQRRSLEAESARFERGLTTSHDLLQFQNALTLAESNEMQAVIDYNIAILKLRKATGVMLKERVR